MIPTFPPSMPRARPRAKRLTFGKAEKSNPWIKILAWIFIAVCAGGIAAMIVTNPKQKPLICHNRPGSVASLTTMGTCTTE